MTLFPILPTAPLLYLIQPVDSELEAAIEAIEVPPMATALAIPVVISPIAHSHQNVKLYIVFQSLTVKVIDVTLASISPSAVKKSPRNVVT